MPFGSVYKDFQLVKELFWCSSAVCLVACQHIIVTTIFLQIWGPGLALYGPIGSMAKAAEGLRAQMKGIFFAYVLAVLSFAFSTLMSFWVLMYTPAASISTVVFFFGGCVWWRYCARIYNRVSNLYLPFLPPCGPKIEMIYKSLFGIFFYLKIYAHNVCLNGCCSFTWTQ